MVELITEIAATAAIAIAAVTAAASILSEKRRERSRVLVPVRVRATRR